MRWLLLLLLAGCATPATFSPGTVAIQDELLVDATGWNRFEEKEGALTEFWTMDGIALDRLRFFVAVGEGDSLAKPLGKRPLPAFRAAMSAHEIVELYEAFCTEDASAFSMRSLSPALFLGAPGFRFEFDLRRRLDDLAVRGLGYGAVVDGRLYLVIYSAPKLHYFDRHLAAAETVVRSALLARRD